MLSNLSGTHAVVILVIVLLLFGASKLPALAKSLGQSVRILKDEASVAPRATTQQETEALPLEDIAYTREYIYSHQPPAMTPENSETFDFEQENKAA